MLFDTTPYSSTQKSHFRDFDIDTDFEETPITPLVKERTLDPKFRVHTQEQTLDPKFRVQSEPIPDAIIFKANQLGLNGYIEKKRIKDKFGKQRAYWYLRYWEGKKHKSKYLGKA